MSEQRFKVYSGMDETLSSEIATLVFQNGKLADSISDVPAWWDKPPEEYGKKFLFDIAHHLTPEQFQSAHPSMVMVPEKGAGQ